MCGIYAYQGEGNATQIVFSGLKKLEYRGYDSWGVASKTKDGVRMEKHTGKIGSAKLSLPKSNIAVGHTRWATHGGVTEKNSHPHTDCSGRIVVVHNGIIENYEGIKDDLVKGGHKFLSETDTEVFPHLVEEYMKEMSFEEACKKAFKKVKGLSTLVTLDVESGHIVAFKNGSPLVAGKDKDGAFYLSSDIPALLSNTNDVVIIEDGEGVVINDDMWKVGKNGKKEKVKTQVIHMDEEKVEKGSFPHFLIKEITEEPEVIRRVAQSDRSEIEKVSKKIKSAYGTFFTACGTASYAGLAATYLFADIASHHVNFTVGSEFPYFEKFMKEDSLLIAASQSGETMDTLEAVRAAKRQNSDVLAFVNVPGSSLSRMADDTILLKAGPERSVMSTKAFIAKLSYFLLIAHTMNGDFDKGKKLLERMSKSASSIIKKRDSIQDIAKKIYKWENIYLIGRGVNYPIALEGALKIKESSYIHAEGFAAGELKHGVIALIEEGTPCVVIQAEDDAKDEVMSNAMELKARGAHIIGISPKKQSVYDDWIKVDDAGTASPIINTVPLHILGYELTLLRGEDPDMPRNLAKSVTVK